MFYIKQIVRSILNLFNIDFYNTINTIKVSKKIWMPINNREKNKSFKLYYEGLNISKSTWSDNLSKQLKFFSLIQMVQYVLNKEFIGDFVECGCWKGHSSWIIAKLITERKIMFNFHIFDSFEGGLSELHIKDKNKIKNLSEKEIINQKNHFSSNEEFVKRILNGFDFVKIYKGWIPKRFDEIKNNSFQFIHIDLDLYEPTLESLKFFFPRLINGGVIVCDDYNETEFPGAKKAWDEYFENKDLTFFYESPYGGCFLIK